ncbi:response regulator transcription factor [Cohnella caldifontis]|uniref:response regulator transcription factor n=1 Tax=Cohnella caldifontis TaxID=3027471 RepID=UPI0023EDCF11|nr:response regulator transcription factor [Cohnella sp. YIM B05605]
MERILIVDGDPAWLEQLNAALRRAGMAPNAVGSCADAWRSLESNPPDLVLLEPMIESRLGFHLLRELRERGFLLPVVLIGDRPAESDQILGFGYGADDFVAKPIGPAGLAARLRAHIRRMDRFRECRCSDDSTRAAFRLDRESNILYKKGRPIPLTEMEAAIFGEMLGRPNRTFSKAQLFQAVWKHTECDENTLNVYINRLRKKVEDNPGNPAFLLTVRGVGYRLEIADRHAESDLFA